MKLSKLCRRSFLLLSVVATLSAIRSHAEELTSVSSWSFVTIDGDSAAQEFVISNESFRVSASINKPVHTNFVFLPLNGNGHITARISGTPNAVQSGLMVRDGLSNTARYTWMCLISNNAVAFERRREPGENSIRTLETNISNVRYLRLVREGTAFSGYCSIEGTNWVQISADTIEMGNESLSGFASADGETVFDQVRVMSASLLGPRQNARFVVPTNILLKPHITATPGEKPRSMEFFSGFNKIGKTVQSPYVFDWTNALAGNHSLTAKITDVNGAEFFTEPVHCEIALPLPHVKFVGVDETTRGDWRGKYGAEGFNIIRHATNYPAYAEVSPKGHKSALAQYTSNPGALLLTNGHHRIAAHWYSSSNMTVRVSLLDGKSHRISFYCHDWGTNARVQVVDVVDSTGRAMMDSRRITQFASGKYYSWNVQGEVIFRLMGGARGGPLLSGIFFDPKTTSPLDP